MSAAGGGCEQVPECFLVSKVCGRPQSSHQVSVKICGASVASALAHDFPPNRFLPLQLGVGCTAPTAAQVVRRVCVI